MVLRKSVGGLNQSGLTEFIKRACRAIGLHGSVDVLVTGNRELRALNNRFRHIDAATDVLSFPAENFANGFAGDIAVSAEMAARNARVLGHPPAEEIRILVLHGLLHLAGYDHELDHGEMAHEETRLQLLLGLRAGLIERSAAVNHSKRNVRFAASRANRGAARFRSAVKRTR